MDELQQEITKQVVDKTVGNVYTDLVQPTAKSLGSILNFLPGIIAAYLTKCQDWLINGKKSIELTAQAVQEKIQNIPEEKLTEPEANIAIPAIQQLSYCYDCEELRKMYANLLVTSMNIDTKSSAHPAFVDIIKQLTPDEAKLLGKIVYQPPIFYPLIDVNFHIGNSQGLLPMIKNFSDLAYGVCEYPNNIAAYLENLNRLGIIEISNTKWINDDSKYEQLQNHPVVKTAVKDSIKNGAKINYSKKLFNVTSFGINFMKSCIA